MRKIILTWVLFLGLSQSVSAGEHANALSQCLISNTSAADKEIITKWVYSTLSQHPSVRSMSSISVEKSLATNKEMAGLAEKFMYDKCLDQVKAAVKNEGPQAIEESLRSYAMIAGQDILSDPSITGNVTELAKHLDLMKLFKALMAE